MEANAPVSVAVPVRVATTEVWASTRLVLRAGEMGVDVLTNARRFGDGVNLWDALPDAAGGSTSALLAKAGGTMTGALVLSGDPATPLEAATRQYVLARIADLTAGTPAELNTFLEAYNRFLADETALSNLTTALAGKADAAATTAALAGKADAAATTTALAGKVSTRSARRLLIATTNNAAGGGVAGAQTTAGTSRRVHTVGFDCSDVRLAYTNVISPDADGPNAYPIKAGIESGGTIYRAPFNGTATKTLDPGGVATSDPIGLDLAAGATVYSRTYISATNWRPNTSSANTTAGFTATSDLTDPGAAAISNTFAYMFSPAAILAYPKDPTTALAVMIIGDSIGTGLNDTNTLSHEGTQTNGAGGGFIPRALFGKAGWTNVAVGGETMQTFRAQHYRRVMLYNHVTDQIDEYGVNDVFGGRTLAQLQADTIFNAQLAQRRGVRAWKTTITPKTNAGNTATVSSGADTIRQNYNAWLVAGAPVNPTTIVAVAIGTAGALLAGQTGHPLTGVFDVAAQAQSATNPSLWANVSDTTDGLHPETAVHIRMATAINVPAMLAAPAV